MPKLDENTVYLIDGSGYIFRAFFAVRPLHSRAGIPTNAVYGFCTMIIKLLRTHKPKYLAIAFDQKGKTFRHDIYEQYKANRSAPPEELVPQFELIHRLVDALKIKKLIKTNFEADDLIATVAKRIKQEGHEVVIVTGDKDLMQLVDEKTFLLDELRAVKMGAEQFIDENRVKEVFGVNPAQVCDLLALAGDTSDNIPGISGIGPKIAAELINEFGSLEKILELAPLIKQNSRRQKIIEGHKLALLSKKLVSLDYDVDISCSLADMKYNNINKEETINLFKELDFNKLLSDQTLFGQISKEVTTPEVNHLESDDDIIKLISKLQNTTKIALDTETDSLDSMQANLLALSLSFAAGQSIYITRAQLDLDKVRQELNKLFSNKQITFVAENAKYHHKVLIRHGFSPFEIGGDPVLANYLLHLDQQPLRAKSLVNLTLELEKQLLTELEQNSLNMLYKNLELPLEEVLSHMEMRGVAIDKSVLAQLDADLTSRLVTLKEKAYELAGCEFNLASPKQVGEILFEKLALPPIKKTKSGFSTDSSVLEKLKNAHGLPNILLEHRMCSKLINTYVEVLPKLVNSKTGRIHTSYNQFVTSTGRLSSSDPNLQNIPVRTIEGRKIRQAFIAKPGYKLISLDYSQVELRLLAYVSQDKLLLDSFAKDQDVHLRTASEIFDQDQADISKAQRNIAKTINFGLLYGMGAQKLSQTLNIARADANKFLQKYFEKYSGITSWKEQALKQAQASGEVRTLFGRKRALPELASKNPMIYSRGERIAINTPIQGSSADIIKKAMIDTYMYLSKNYPQSGLIMQVHDELVIEALENDTEEIATAVAKIMSRGHGLDLDLKVEYGMAKNWDDAH